MFGIDCNHCSEVLYDLKTGKPVEHAGRLLPVSQPPCVDDPKVCPKVKPGHSDFTDENLAQFLQWQFYESINRNPDDMWYQRTKRIIEQSVEQAQAERDRILRKRLKDEPDQSVFKVGG